MKTEWKNINAEATRIVCQWLNRRIRLARIMRGSYAMYTAMKKMCVIRVCIGVFNSNRRAQKTTRYRIASF